MSWRKCLETDREMLLAHMRAHLGDAMFPFVNLRDHAMGGPEARAMEFWWDGQNAMGLTREGMAMPVAPYAPDWAALRPSMVGRKICGILGETQQLRALQGALGLGAAEAKLDHDEPAFALDLAEMVMPEMDGFSLSPITAETRPLAIDWRAAYHAEILGTPEENCAAQAVKDINKDMVKDSHRILWQSGTAVAMTGFNATVEETVQIGGVYTPPERRRQGLARRAVALHLAEARAQGFTRSVLFAASDNAARAYRAIGFQRRGAYTILLLRSGEMVQ